MSKKNNAMKNETGRTILETLAFFVVFILLTFGGVQLYHKVEANVVAQALIKTVGEEALVRQHDLMKQGRNNSDTNVVVRKGAYSVEIVTEDGVDGDSADFFMISLSAVDSYVWYRSL